MRLSRLLPILFPLAALLPAAELNLPALQKELRALESEAGGRLGICVQSARGTACTRPEERFSLQSVMKLLVGMAALDAVDHQGWKVTDPITVRRENLSLFMQPVAQLVTGPEGYRTTVGDLVRRGIIDSDSAAADILLDRLGGTAAVERYFASRGITGIRLDRDERHLQTEIVGLTWRPEYVDAALLRREIDAVPEAVRTRSYERYRTDPRDTSTPRGFAAMLARLERGELLSPASTAFILQAMRDCVTGADRLRAGAAAPGWTVAHKTGTSGSWKGNTVATNDVGLLTAPDGTSFAVAVFVADSNGTDAQRAAWIARVAQAVIRHTR